MRPELTTHGSYAGMAGNMDRRRQPAYLAAVLSEARLARSSQLSAGDVDPNDPDHPSIRLSPEAMARLQKIAACL